MRRSDLMAGGRPAKVLAIMACARPVIYSGEGEGADLVTRALDALADLGRIAARDPAQTAAQALHEGAGLVERKLMKALEGVGLERVDPAGQPFDPNLHEAVAQAEPAEAPEGPVVQQLRKGYRLRGRLLRPAAVVVAKAPAA